MPPGEVELLNPAELQADVVNFGITLLGYGFSNVAAFKKFFLDFRDNLSELIPEYTFDFIEEILPLEIIDTEGAKLPHSVLKNFAFASRFKDSIFDIIVDYDDVSKRLIIWDGKIDRMEHDAQCTLLIEFCKILIEEHTSRIRAIGFNFELKFKEQTPIELISTPESRFIEELPNGGTLRSSDFSPVYEWNNFLVTYNVGRFSEEEGFKLFKANYHNDRYSTVRSLRTIQDSVIQDINQHYKACLYQFLSITRGLLR